MSKKFKPTKAMKQYLRSFIDPESPETYSGVAEEAGLDKRIYWKWKDRYGRNFLNWFNAEVERGMKEAVSYLDKIGLKKAKDSFPHWNAMQEKYGNLKKKISIQGDKENPIVIEGEIDVGEMSEEQLQKEIRKMLGEVKEEASQAAAITKGIRKKRGGKAAAKPEGEVEG